MTKVDRSRPRIVVIGVGNTYRGDDALGVEVARRVRPLVPDGVDVVERDGEPSGLIDAWENADVAVVIDAVCSRDGQPGGLHRVELDQEVRLGSVRAISSHRAGPGDAVELARVLDRLPERLVLFGVEGRSFSHGRGLSPEVEASIPMVMRHVLEEVSRSDVHGETRSGGGRR
jgi:hydrogenase maturation protease